ncbi:MAG: helix-turn-helix domain-containing protein [Treponema sp.]|jgi:transcriptional regulator with XRE-family HTH domain|nr:helix-turn-helix domain-containing protein [Treponema sp.]
MFNKENTINERIIKARRALGMSQAKFAAGIKLSDGYIAKIETGKRRAHDRIIKIISMIYGVNEERLKPGRGNMFDRIEDFKSEQITGIFKKLDPLFQDYVLTQLGRLLEIQGILKTSPQQEEK